MDNNCIEQGKEKVIKEGFEEQLKYLDNTFLEVLGKVPAEYFGTSELDNFRRNPDVFDYKFYKAKGNELIECSLDEACSTSEYIKVNIDTNYF